MKILFKGPYCISGLHPNAIPDAIHGLPEEEKPNASSTKIGFVD
jgi:hypothetical protein